MRHKLFYIPLLFLASCSSEKPDNIEPTLHTLEATAITRTSATLHGYVGLRGKTAMPALKFRYGRDNLSLTANADAETDMTDDRIAKVDDGYVFATIDGLRAGKTYQYQLQATNGNIVLYGDTMTFTTLPNVLPAIGESAVLSHGPVSAIVGFDIPDDGGEDLTEAGCYVTEGSLPNSDSKTGATKVKAKKTAAKDLPWRAIITNLKMNTPYTFTPYAVNAIGEALGKHVSFTTGSAYVVSEPGDLASLVSGNNIGSSIAITGSLNGDDIACLRSLTLKSIDMTDAHIVSGGSPYDESHYTEDNVIGQGFFAGCTTLEDISLPDDVTMIAQDAFSGCSALREFTVPSSAVSVSTSVGCTALKSINVSAGNVSFKSIDGVLTDAAVNKVVWFPMGKTDNYSLPSTIKAIGDNAFRGCSLTAFNMADNITALGTGAFAESKLEEVRLSNRLATVPTAAFQRCGRLKTIRLGSATELVADYAFDGCPLTDLYIDATTPPACSGNAFTTTGPDFTKTCTLHVPTGCAKYYRASKYWNVFAHIVE